MADYEAGFRYRIRFEYGCSAATSPINVPKGFPVQKSRPLQVGEVTIEPRVDRLGNWTETQAESKFGKWPREKNQKHGGSRIDW